MIWRTQCRLKPVCRQYYEAGALVLRCRWWVLLACSELARQPTKDDFSRPTGPACRLPRVALEQMLVLDLRTDMACILESERAHACLFMSVFRDIGRDSVKTRHNQTCTSCFGDHYRPRCVNISRHQHLCTLQLASGHQPSIRLHVVQVWCQNSL